MFASLIPKPCTVHLTLGEEQVITHPRSAAVGGPDMPGQDPVIRGTVLLEVAVPRAVSRVKVVFEGLCDLFDGAGFKSETITTIHKELEIDLKGEVLEKGSHALSFAFDVPSSTATFQRCAAGRTRHYVKATVDFVGTFQPSVRSYPVHVWLVANPNPPGEVLSTQLSLQYESADFGPVQVQVSSAHLTVASLLNVRLALLSTNLAATIISVNAVITQTFEVHYTNPAAIATLPDERHILAKVAASAKPRPYATEPAEVSPERVASTSRERERGREPRTRWPTPRGRGSRSRTASPFEGAVVDLPEGGSCSAVGDDLIEVDSMPVAELGAGSEWSYSRVMRVPNDDFVRATTLEGTDDRVRVGHVLAVEVRYRLKGEDFDKMMRIVKGITITSCCCQVDSLYLPSYASSAPTTIIEPAASRCACNRTLQELVDRDGEQLKRAGEISLDPGVEVLALGTDRQDKTPAVSGMRRWQSGGGRVEA